MDKEKLFELLEDYLADADKVVIEKKKKAKEPEEVIEKEDDIFENALKEILGNTDKDED